MKLGSYLFLLACGCYYVVDIEAILGAGLRLAGRVKRRKIPVLLRPGANAASQWYGEMLVLFIYDHLFQQMVMKFLIMFLYDIHFTLVY